MKSLRDYFWLVTLVAGVIGSACAYRAGVVDGAQIKQFEIDGYWDSGWDAAMDSAKLKAFRDEHQARMDQLTADVRLLHLRVDSTIKCVRERESTK